MMNMKKKKYIAPECEIVELEGAVYMQAASFKGELGDDLEYGSTQDANRHRGEWGNLWSNMK